MVLLVALLLFGLLQSLANSGVRLRCGMILLLQGQDGQVQNILAFLTSNSNSPVGDVPPMTSHEVFHCHGFGREPRALYWFLLIVRHDLEVFDCFIGVVPSTAHHFHFDMFMIIVILMFFLLILFLSILIILLDQQAVASASAFLRQSDPVKAAKALNHAAPLTVAGLNGDFT